MLPDAPEQGFTLVELMVVVAIVGLASAAVVVALPDPRGRVVDEAARFAARALAARDDAVVEGRAMSVRIDATGYVIERRRRGRWETAAGRAFSPVRWASGTSVALGDDGLLRATFDPTGAASAPVTVDLARGDARVRVGIGGDGGIRVGN